MESPGILSHVKLGDKGCGPDLGGRGGKQVEGSGGGSTRKAGRFHFPNQGDVFFFQRGLKPSQHRRAVMKCSTVKPKAPRLSTRRKQAGRVQKQTSRSKVRVGTQAGRGQPASFSGAGEIWFPQLAVALPGRASCRREVAEGLCSVLCHVLLQAGGSSCPMLEAWLMTSAC